MDKKNIVYTAAAFAVVLAGAHFVDYLFGIRSSSLPACDSPDVVMKAKAVLKESVFAQALNVRDFEFPVESSYDSKSEKRICMATLKTPVGQERVSYTVQWHDKKAKIFWLEFQN